MILKKEKLNRALEAMAGHGTVLVPSQADGVRKFVPYRPGVNADFDMVSTLLPPKDVLFPQTEKMYRFRMEEQTTVEEIVDAGKQILFGVRPCDAASIERMDQVFLTKGFVDSFYGRKRENLTVIAMACSKAAETCFCDSMGIDPGAAPIADILLTPAAAGWNVAAQSDKGRALIQALPGVFDEGEAEPLPKAACALKTDMSGVPEKLRGMFEHPVWDELFRQCLGCGTCTYICPTCYCFEISSETQGKQGTQFRCWDSCMFSEYTRMAGGHNPRPSRKERVRNRYLHKLAYFEERYGKCLCVGCGRCVEKCPVGMDITRVIDMVREEEPVCGRK